MAKTRHINTRFWDDDFVTKMEPAGKLLFLYFLTNPLTDLCGAYEVTMKRIVFDTGLKPNKVQELLTRFEAAGKIAYRDGWVLIRNFAKHQQGSSPNVKKGVERSLSACPDWVKETLSKGWDSARIENALLPVPIPRPEPTEVAASAADETTPVVRRIWKDGVDLLTSSGISNNNARSFLGKKAKEFGEDRLAEAIAVAQAKNPADPTSFIVAVLQDRAGASQSAKVLVGKYVPEPEPKYACGICFDSGESFQEVPEDRRLFAGQMETVPCPKGCEVKVAV